MNVKVLFLDHIVTVDVTFNVTVDHITTVDVTVDHIVTDGKKGFCISTENEKGKFITKNKSVTTPKPGLHPWMFLLFVFSEI